jgi:hypothetical protein
MLNILTAYPYMKKPIIEVLKDNQEDIKFILDSGAFTAWKSGKPISLDEYCLFIEKLSFKPWRYFTLDEIGNPEKSFENYNKMLERGFNPIPIFTRGEDIKMIDEYYKTSDMIGIGGLVGTKGNKGFVKGVMDIIGNRKCHWLGFNAKEFIHHYKPYTCDSSSWSGAVRFASCKLYVNNGRWIHVQKEDFYKRPKEEVINTINEYGIDYRRLGQASEWKNSGKGDYALEILTCRSWTKYQLDLRKKLGVEFFFACGQDRQVKLMLDSYKYWKQKENK